MSDFSIDKHLHHLVSKIGCRFIGSQGNAAAADYIESIFTASGLKVKKQTYPCPSWEARECRLEIAEKKIDAIANTYSPSCKISAPTKVARSIEELETKDVQEHILVLCGEFTTDPIMSLVDNAIYLPDRDRRIGNLLRRKKPLAIITVGASPGYRPILLEDPRLGIPSVTVGAEAGLALTRDEIQSVHLTISSHKTPGQTWNVIGNAQGTSASGRIIVCAHYDTKNGTLGAWDNASGVSALLAIVQHFANNPLPISIEYIAFSAEEYGIEDTFEDPYLSEYGLTIPPFVYGKQISAPYKPSDLDNVLAVINLDGVGQILTANTVATMACSDSLKGLVQSVKGYFPKVVSVGGGPASNHYGFYANGIPCIPIGSLDMKNVLHDERDTLEWISSDRISEVCEFSVKLTHALSDKTPSWCRIPRDHES